jgi:excisionase family DNA binding protein
VARQASQAPKTRLADRGVLEELLTVDEAAGALRVSAQFIYRHAQNGDLPSVSVGTSVRIKVSTVRAIIDGELDLAKPKPAGGRRSRRLVPLPDRA